MASYKIMNNGDYIANIYTGFGGAMSWAEVEVWNDATGQWENPTGKTRLACCEWFSDVVLWCAEKAGFDAYDVDIIDNETMEIMTLSSILLDELFEEED